ncbi:MAG: aminotransferase class I/II-fold pyridoxal phosphate-dependent enzyme [Candidatus Peribacteraceae bacterium]|nr:aminotransferase class I/II-fold pyridoxal phosphate-dependent enzyme [Candidatus Peribacteraceae bacterium]
MTLHRSQLAILGGTPIFSEKLYVGRPNTGDRQSFIRRVNDALDRRWLTNDGPYVQEFEQRVAQFLGVRHCVTTCNGTAGLQLAIRALGLEGEVIVPSFTFVATPHALQWQGITPCFCDVQPDGFHLDPAAIEAAITSKTTGILGVHLWGRPCEIERLQFLAEQHNLKLLFDAAHAFGCSYHGRMIGGFGDAEVLSFHATKVLSTLEGGAIATNNDAIAREVRLLRNFGFADGDTIASVGINAKMNEISAAMGLASLERLDAVVEANRQNYDAYRTGLAGINGLRLYMYDESETNSYYYIVIEVDEQRMGIDRDTLLQVLHAENVIARRYFYPGCHRVPPYTFTKAGILPQTERLASCTLSLPTGETVGAEDIRKICQIISQASEDAEKIRWSLKRKHFVRSDYPTSICLQK